MAPASTGSKPAPVRWKTRVESGDYATVVSEASATGIDSVTSTAPLDDLVALSDAARYSGHGDIAKKALFDAIGKARAGAHRLGVAAAADGLTLRCRCHVRIEQGVGDRLGAGAGQAQREAGKGFEHEAY